MGERESSQNTPNQVEGASMDWNLIWEWGLTLPSFVLANCQTTVYFQHTFKLCSGLATGLHVSNNYRSYYGLILAPYAMDLLRSSVPGNTDSSFEIKELS
jgi:hypothetical protein